MIYIITEIQTNTDGTLGILTFTATERYEAEAIYHEKLAFAARSELPCHAVTLCDNEGHQLNFDSYKHGVE